MDNFSEFKIEYAVPKNNPKHPALVYINEKPLMQEGTNGFNEAGFYVGQIPSGNFTQFQVDLDYTDIMIIDFDGELGLGLDLGYGLYAEFRLFSEKDRFWVSARMNDASYMKMSDAYRELMRFQTLEKINKQCCN